MTKKSSGTKTSSGPAKQLLDGCVYIFENQSGFWNEVDKIYPILPASTPAALFALGIVAIVSRRNVLYVLFGIEMTVPDYVISKVQ